jgi:hypothetical protein
VTFPWERGYVGATWTGSRTDPQIGWPATGWSLADSSLIVVSGALSDTTPRFELGITRAAARARAESRTAWLHAASAIVALMLTLGVVIVGRAARGRHLRAAERSSAESQLRAARAETAASQAGLAAIQARLNPHFLSNALHSVAALIATDPDAAEEALDRLGDLFRYSLEQSERRSVYLEDEWRFVQDYLASRCAWDLGSRSRWRSTPRQRDARSPRSCCNPWSRTRFVTESAHAAWVAHCASPRAGPAPHSS